MLHPCMGIVHIKKDRPLFDYMSRKLYLKTKRGSKMLKLTQYVQHFVKEI